MSDYIVDSIKKVLSVRIYLPELILGGGSPDTLNFFWKKLLTGWHLELLGGGQSGYSNFFLYLAVLGGGELKKTPCMIISNYKSGDPLGPDF